MKKIKVDITAKNVLFRITACLVILFIGFIAMISLASQKKPPAEAKPEELVLKVNALKVKPEDIWVTISGYGEVQPLNIVSISPEVSGRVVSIHPRLEPGEVVKKGELLFAVDRSNYQSAVDEAQASVSQLQNTIKRLNAQFKIDKDRLVTLERSRDLTRDEFDRLKGLLENHNVGTRSAVDAAERSFNVAVDQVDQMQEAVIIYPLRIKEAESALSAARARLEMAEINLDRCRVKAPFSGRIKKAGVESGQYVFPGQPAIIFADDNTLEILVPLDSRDARKWLKFDSSKTDHSCAWFNHLEECDVRIRWTEDEASHTWTGRLNRVVAFTPKTRTLNVAIRISSRFAVNNNGDLPLVEGMFCRVEIPGRILRNVIRLPSWAVSFQNTVYIAKDNRLKTLAVNIGHKEGDAVFVSEGLATGDLVVTTRLVDPLENTLLQISVTDEEDKAS